MKISVLLSTVFVCVLLDDRSVSHSSYFHSKQATVKITEKSIGMTPDWLDDAENPPLDARRAIQNAKQFMETIVKDTRTEKWVLQEASLRPYRGKKWYWLVCFEAHPVDLAGATGPPVELRLAVLMDGTVVKPKITEINRVE